jgi:hypothetical protein
MLSIPSQSHLAYSVVSNRHAQPHGQLLQAGQTWQRCTYAAVLQLLAAAHIKRNQSRACCKVWQPLNVAAGKAQAL